MNQANKKYQLLKYTISAASESVKIEAETDKLYKRCTGIHVTQTVSSNAIDSTLNNFKINSKEIFPEGFEVKMINTGQDVSPEDRFYKLDEPAAGSKIEGTYTDKGNAAIYPYTLIIYLRLEKE